MTLCKDNLPLGRIGMPDDIAKVHSNHLYRHLILFIQVVLFLADRSQSEFIVGQRITVDGGTVLQNCMLSRDMMAAMKTQ